MDKSFTVRSRGAALKKFRILLEGVCPRESECAAVRGAET